jgi:hypothetical protein
MFFALSLSEERNHDEVEASLIRSPLSIAPYPGKVGRDKKKCLANVELRWLELILRRDCTVMAKSLRFVLREGIFIYLVVLEQLIVGK